MAPATLRSLLAMEHYRPLLLSVGRREIAIRSRDDAALLGDGSALEVISDGRRHIISTNAIVSITLDRFDCSPTIVETVQQSVA